MKRGKSVKRVKIKDCRMEINRMKKIKIIVSDFFQQSEWEDKIFSLGVKVFVWMISIIITSGFLNTVCFVSGFLVCGFSLFFQIFDFSGETNIESDHQENIQIDPPQTVRIPSSCTISVARDLLRKYEDKTGLEEAGILLDRFWIVEEKKIPLPHTFQTQELPMLTSALQTFFDLPDEVSEDLQRSLEKNINDMIIPLLRETQIFLDSHYEQKRLEVEIDSEVVQALHPKDPFRTDPVEVAKRTDHKKSMKRKFMDQKTEYIYGNTLDELMKKQEDKI